jgi:hypothetical protein
MNKRIPFFALLPQVALTQAQSATTPGHPSIPFEKWLPAVKFISGNTYQK